MHKTIYIVILTFISIFTSGHIEGLAQSYKKVDSLLYQATNYATEDPNRSMQIALESVRNAKKIEQKELLVEAYLICSESCLNQNLIDISKSYVDSANNISTKYNLKKALIQCIITSGKIQKKIGNDDLYIANLNEAKKVAIKSSLNDEIIKVELLLADYKKFNGKFEESLSTKKKALDFANKTKIKSLVADCWNSIGSTYWYFSHYTESLENYYKAFIIREEIKDTVGIIVSLKNLGLVYRDLSNFDKSLSSLNQALKLTDQTSNQQEAAEVLNLLGSLHFRFNRYNEAILYYKQCLEIRNRIGYLNSSANTLENIARVFIQKTQFDDALEALNKALSIRDQLNDQLGISTTQNEIGNLYNQKGNIAEALRRYLISLRIRQRLGQDQDIAKSLTNIGLTYRKLGSLKNATNYLEQARTLILAGQDPSEAAYVLINLGNIYIDQKRYSDALNVFQEALTMRKKTGDESSTARTYRNIAQAQIQIKQYDKARNNLNSALKIFQKLNDGRAIADTYNDLGNLERNSGNLLAAINNFETAAKIYEESATFDGKALCLRKIGEIQIQLGQFDNAEKNINQSITTGIEMANMVLVHYGYLAKHELYKATKNYKLALEYYTKHIKIRDSLDAVRRNEKNLEAQLDLELDKKKEEIRSMESEVQLLRQESMVKELKIEKQRTIQYSLIIVGILILTVAGLFIVGYYQKKNHNQLLKEKIAIIRDTNDKLYRSEKELKVTLQTKDKLFSIIAHDLKSPFTALIGISEILDKRIEDLSKTEIKELSSLLHQSSQKVHVLLENLLNWSRSQTGNIKIVPEALNLNEIVQSCIDTLKLSADDKEIKFISRIHDHDIAYADKETIRTVIRNLLSNAIKFTPQKGRISITCSKTDKFIEIYISDNGIGISKNNLSKLFKIEGAITTEGTNKETGTGLGLIICKEFIEKNSGEISVESELNVGTTFKIKLPVDTIN